MPSSWCCVRSVPDTFRADLIAFGDGAVSATSSGPDAPHVGTGGGQLNDKFLPRLAAGLDLYAEVCEQFEVVHCGCNIVQPNRVRFHFLRVQLSGLLSLEAINGRLMPEHTSFLRRIGGKFLDFCPGGQTTLLS